MSEDKEKTDESNRLFDLMKLHPIVTKNSKSLFKTRHYASAIFEAFKALNNYVKMAGNSDLDGKKLMAEVFKGESPALRLNDLTSRSDKDEQEGFMLIFMGAMHGIRNPKAHETVVQSDPYKTLEYLAFASLLAKRVDEAKGSFVEMFRDKKIYKAGNLFAAEVHGKIIKSSKIEGIKSKISITL